jgi:hypothetical protein
MSPRMSLVLCLWITSCTALYSQTPVTHSLTVPSSQDVAFDRATRAMARLGGELTQTNRQEGLLTAKVHNAVLLTVLVRPSAEGSTIEATGTLLPNKLAVGTFDEVEQYLRLVQEQP